MFSRRRLRRRVARNYDLSSTSPELSDSTPHDVTTVSELLDSEAGHGTIVVNETGSKPQNNTTTETTQHIMSGQSSTNAVLDTAAPSKGKAFAALLTADLLSIHVGIEQKQYCLHRNLLFSQSSFFEQAANKRSTDSDDAPLILDEVQVAPFELFVEWLYRGTIQPMSADAKFSGGSGHGELYFLAGEWKMENLQNTVMDSVITWCRDHCGRVDDKTIRIIFNHDDPSPPLRQFVVRQAAHFLSTSDWATEEDEWRKLIDIGGDFGFEVMKVLRDPSRRKIKSPGDQPSCDFHRHADGKRCDGKK